jgi:hypothetical protein
LGLLKNIRSDLKGLPDANIIPFSLVITDKEKIDNFDLWSQCWQTFVCFVDDYKAE